MKEINIRTGEVHMNLASGQFYVTADAMATLKDIGEAYQLFSGNDERHGRRLSMEYQPQTMLVAQERVGDGEWEPVRVVVKDQKQIRACLAFQELLDAIAEMEQEKAREIVPRGKPGRSHDER